MLQAIDAFRSRPISGRKIRHHGDFHLGQALLSNNDFVIIDFEGEPARTLEERRRKHSPLRDVAGMIRSFNYAARAALAQLPSEGFSDRDMLEAAALQWEAEAVAVFTEAYAAVASHSVLFEEWADMQALLKLFILEKTLYELRYELSHRPDWVAITAGRPAGAVPGGAAARAGETQADGQPRQRTRRKSAERSPEWAGTGCATPASTTPPRPCQNPRARLAASDSVTRPANRPRA